MPSLILAAYPPELDRLRGRLPDGVRARAVGIGLVDAAAGTARAIAEEQPGEIVLVGSAGALPGAPLAVGAVGALGSVRLIERGCEYLPGPLASTVRADARLLERAQAIGLPVAVGLCGLGITRSEAEAERLSSLGAVEHLEAFAVLRVAEQLGVPAIALLAIANRVGPDAHAEWLAHREEAESAAQSAVLRFLGSLS